MPKNPIITEGIDAMISIAGLIISRINGLASSERYTAIERLRGTAKIEASNVTEREAVMRGKIPYRGFSLVGYQSVPKMKSFRETDLNIGSPSLNRKIMMSSSTIRHAKAMTENNF